MTYFNNNMYCKHINKSSKFFNLVYLRIIFFLIESKEDQVFAILKILRRRNGWMPFFKSFEKKIYIYIYV